MDTDPIIGLLSTILQQDGGIATGVLQTANTALLALWVGKTREGVGWVVLIPRCEQVKSG